MRFRLVCECYLLSLHEAIVDKQKDEFYEWMRKKGMLSPSGEVVSMEKERYEERIDVVRDRRIEAFKNMMREHAAAIRSRGGSDAQAIAQLSSAHDITALILHQLCIIRKTAYTAASDVRLGPGRQNAAVLLPGIDVAGECVDSVSQGIRDVLVELGVSPDAFHQVPVE